MGRLLQPAGALHASVWFPAPAFWVLCAVLLALIAWRIRDRAQVRRHLELRESVRHRTVQLERGQALEASRNRIMEMLVSNVPQRPMVDAIARLVQDQLPGALCVVLAKPAHGLRSNHDLNRGDLNRGDFNRGDPRREGESDVLAGTGPGIPPQWLAAIGCQRAVPFEVWRELCDYGKPREKPAWRQFFSQLEASLPAGPVPVAIRSVPIGESGVASGALLLAYPEPPGSEPWEKILRVSARLAQIAIEHRRFCDELNYHAHHDSLTGLANRALLDERLETVLLEAQSNNQRLALLYIDIDSFKQVNDHFSHRVGDALLVELGRRMKAALRPGDTVARIGGDEFNVLLPDVGDAESALQFASRLLETARSPFSVNGHDLAVTVSIGFATFAGDDDESCGGNPWNMAASDLQRQADAAMYYAKSLGKNRIQAFADNAQALDGVRMEQDLRHALQEGWFAVHYQPKFTAADELAGLEALIRMNHPRHGRILPGQFIPIAEASGLIVPMGAWVIAEVCRQIAEWRRRSLNHVVVAVNVSAVQMSRVDFAKTVENCLAAHSVPPSCLEIEVTESMVIDADSEGHRQMQLLRAMGVVISIDDFGTGFSSLSYLHRLQIDAVKLDRSFVRTIATDDAAQRLVRAMIGVAQGLGLDVIAEGVETEAQRTELVAAGCPVMQGYLFAHPCPAENIEALLRPDLPRPGRRACESPGVQTSGSRTLSEDLYSLYESLDAESNRSLSARTEERVSA